MATEEEITISELEFTDELADDMILPVESSLDTKSTSLGTIRNWLFGWFQKKTSLLTQQDTVSENTEVIISDSEKTTLQKIKNWLGGFYQAKGNYVTTDTTQTISGYKTFSSLHSNAFTVTADTDLNDIKESGYYYARTTQGAESKNFPSGTNGLLVVISGTYGATLHCRQLFMRLGTLNSTDYFWYVRQFDGDGWGNWKQINNTLSISKAENGQVTNSNGLIIQKGVVSASTAGVTKTLPTPFSDNKYAVVITHNGSSKNEGYVTNKTTSNFTVKSSDSSNISYNWVAIGF